MGENMASTSAEKVSANLDIDLICYLLEDCQQKIKSLEQKVKHLEEDRDSQFRSMSEKQNFHEQECNTRLEHLDIRYDIQQDDLLARIKRLEHQTQSGIRVTEIEVEPYERDNHLIEQIESTLKGMNLRFK